MTLLSNGILGPMPLDDAIGVAKMLVQTGRAIPPSEWVHGWSSDASYEHMEDRLAARL